MAAITAPATYPDGFLEQRFIDAYLESCGHTRRSVRALPADQALRLLRAASDYASLRLAEIDARAHYIEEIHPPH
jgi:hypothetical protein